jgi:hypothetical protein
VDGAVEDAVELEDAEFLVELVLVATVGGDLDDGGDDLRGLEAGGNVVPGVEGAGLDHGGGRVGVVWGALNRQESIGVAGLPQ